MGVAELTAKLESLSQEDYDMVVMLVERLSSKPSDVLRKAREKYLSKNPMSMEEIDEEIERCRNERIGQFID